MLANPFKYRTCQVSWQNDHVKLRSYRRDYITKKLKRGNFYEDDLLQLIAEQYGGPGLFVDVGAFVGNHTVFFAKHCKADGVIAFEPFPETYRLLDHNIRVNRLTSSITAINKAVSSEPGSLTMSIACKKNRGMNRIDADGRTRVEVTTLDSELADISTPIRFLKIDAEGHGSNVIKGAKSILEHHRPVIAVEVDPEPLADISDLLHQSGYIAKSCHNATPTWIFEHEDRMA